MHTVSRACPPLVLVSSLLAAGMMVGGCESAAEMEEANLIDALRAENTELREANNDLQDALERSRGQATSLVEEREQLIEENSRLREQASARPAAALGTAGFAPGTDVTRRGGELVVTIAGDVLFAKGSATLRTDAKRELDSIASVLNSRYGSNQIRIAGHTDPDPIRKSGWKTNERLSAERALSVEEYLQSRGVSGDRMHVAGYGPSRPRGNDAQSRRVEIIILEGAN